MLKSPEPRLAKKWTDRIGELGRRLDDLIRSVTDRVVRPHPEPALEPVRVRVPRS